MSAQAQALTLPPGMSSEARKSQVLTLPLGGSSEARGGCDQNEQVVDGFLVRRAKLVDGCVVDGSALNKPTEVVTNFDGFFQDSGGTNTFLDAVKNGGHKNAWMDRRLTANQNILIGLNLPVELVKNVIQKSDRMILRDNIVEFLRKKH